MGVKEDIAARFRWLLEDRGMSLRKAAELLESAGLRSRGPTALWKVTNAELLEGPSAEWLATVAKAFGVSPAWLAFGLGDPVPEEQPDYGVSDLPRDVQNRVIGLAMNAAARIEGRTLADQLELTELFARRIAAVVRFLAGSRLFVPLSDEADSVLGAERIVDGLGYWLRESIDKQSAEADPALAHLVELAPPTNGEGP